MEKATISINKNKKGGLYGNIKIENGISMSFPPKFIIEEKYNGKECEIERIKGQIEKIIVEGESLKLKDNNSINTKKINDKNTGGHFNRNSASNQRATGKTDIFQAKAPYNFVPLNKVIISYDAKPDRFHRYNEDCNTGYIDIEIEAKTPIFVSESGQDGDYSKFYNQAGKFRIPGSSLRGLIRTMVEITSWGKFEFFNDVYLYYRSFADQAHSVRDEYKKKESGLLYREGLSYYIIPSEKKFIKILKEASKDNPKENNSFDIVKKLGQKYEEFKSYKIKQNEYLVVSGNMPNKKHDWIVFADETKKDDKVIKIDEEDIKSYKNDKDRNKNDKDRKSFDIIDRLKSNGKPSAEPCFYIKWNDKTGKDRISFGHTPLFRLSYKKSIGEHIQQDYSNKDYSNKSECDKFDIPTSIFGTEKSNNSKDSFATFASRVFFEDAFLTDDSLDKEEQENKIPQTLAGPKPTSFQLYLDQNGINDITKLKHYNDDADIRGNKFYWHKDLEDWKTETFNEKMDKKIRPINQGAKFKGKIRFDNLSDIELGALLFAVDLPEHYAHKIGMGKPLGLGSIRINAKLYLSDRQKRYKDLFDEWNGLQEKSGEIKNIKSKFEQFILKELDNGTGKYKSLWDTERLKEFARMLDFSNKPNKEKVSYMKLDMNLKLNEFKNRNGLPKPTKIN
ncbi:MAG: TIGR03986 family type III CRISPR-associated RAMP protein [bacterium]